MQTDLLLRLIIMHQAALIAELWAVAEPHVSESQTSRIMRQNEIIIAHQVLDAKSGESVH